MMRPILFPLLAGFLLLGPFASPAAAQEDASAMPAWKQALEPPPDSDWRKAKQELIFNNGAEPKSLDPAVMTGVPEGRVALGIYEGLVTQDPDTLEPRPGVAETWERSADGKTYTFHLRHDAKWSNGDPLTSEDFRWSFYRALRPGTQLRVDYAYQFYYIRGAKSYHDGKDGSYEGFQKTVGVSVPDPHTVRIELNSPCAYFLELCAFQTYMPVHRATVEKYGADWTQPDHWVGSGPYVLKDWQPNSKIVLTPNPHYWDAGFVKLRKITILPLEDADSAYNKYLKGEVDWITSIPVSKIEEAKRNPDYFVMPYLGSYFYRVNVTKPPLNDKRVRQALSRSIDRETITRDVTKAGQVPATWFCPAMDGYTPPKGLSYDPDAARKLLAEAGYPGGKGFPGVTLLFNTSESHKIVAERVAQMWRENLGITVSLANEEWQAYLNDVSNLNYQIARAGWIGDYSDPNTFLDMFLTGGGNNNTGFSDKEYDSLIAQAQVELDKKKRLSLFRKAESILVDDELPIIPLYIYVNNGMKRDTLQGWYPNIRDVHPYQYLYREPE